MENNLKKLFAKIMMTQEEKSTTKRYLEAFAELHPVRNTDFIRHTLQRSILQRFTLYTRTMPIILAITLLLGGGVSLGAQNSLPGDALYPVKVNINERIRGALTLTSDEARANYQVALVARRLVEAEQVAQDGDINDTVLSRIEANFQRHADNVEERIKQLEAKENFEAAADVNARFENAVRVHEDILRRFAERQADDRDALETLADRARIRGVAAGRIRLALAERFDEETDASRPYAERRMLAAEDRIEDLERLIDSRKGEINDELMRALTSQVELAKKTFAEGETALRGNNALEAARKFNDAWTIANTAMIRLNAEINLRAANASNTASDTVNDTVDTAPIFLRPTIKTQTKVNGTVELKNEIDAQADFSGDLLNQLDALLEDTTRDIETRSQLQAEIQ
ncbi:MAG: DUF5667 domain-containing protein [Patescibacteria group bacterium]